MTNMLHFAGQRDDQIEAEDEAEAAKAATKLVSDAEAMPDPFPALASNASSAAAKAVAEAAKAKAEEAGTFDVAAAQAAISSLPLSEAVDSTLVDSAEVSSEDKLQSLRREEALIEEERQLAESKVSIPPFPI